MLQAELGTEIGIKQRAKGNISKCQETFSLLWNEESSWLSFFLYVSVLWKFFTTSKCDSSDGRWEESICKCFSNADLLASTQVSRNRDES